jgi:hypothetical protein
VPAQPVGLALAAWSLRLVRSSMWPGRQRGAWDFAAWPVLWRARYRLAVAVGEAVAVLARLAERR